MEGFSGSKRIGLKGVYNKVTPFTIFFVRLGVRISYNAHTHAPIL